MKHVHKYVLVGALIAIALVLPLLTDSRGTINLLTHIFIMAIFAMSYDILLGYTGIVSFGHALFFGSGAYITGMILRNAGNDVENAVIALVAALLFALLMAVIIGVLSLRVRETYFAMLTLAFGELFFIGALKLRSYTGGEDGFSFKVPTLLQDRVGYYYLAFVVLVIVAYLLRIFISSPTGKVLQAIRENERRTEAIGFDVFRYKLLSLAVAGTTASLAGVLFALQERFVSASVLGLGKTIDALLMTIVGGTGTLYGAIVGSALISLTQEGFTSLARDYPIFERWQILFGIVYVVVVLFFPGGLVRAFNRLVNREKVLSRPRQQIKESMKGLMRYLGR